MSQTDDRSADEQKRAIAGAFSRAAPGYGDISVFHAFGARLVALAELPSGARVLDVACGRGAVLFAAADAVGPMGQVVGIDLAAGMVEATAAECERRGLSQITVRRMDAEGLDFPDGHFDRVLCGFGIFFFPHPYRALAEFRRVLAPRGRLAISTWGEEDHRWDWLNDLRRAYLPPPPEPPEDAAGDPRPDFRKPEGLRAFLGREGFVDIQVVTVESEPFYASPEQWWAELWTHGARIFLEAIVEKHGQVGLDQFKAEALAKMAPLRQPNGYPERHIAHLTIGTRA